MSERQPDAGPNEDRDRIDAVLAGDRDAFGGLVGRYQGMVAAIVWRFGVSHDDAEDLVSEIFVRAYRNLHRYDRTHAFSTWLYRLATNLVIDHRRRQRKERLRVEMPEQVGDPSPGADDALEAGERALRVRRALGRIDERYREAIELVYMEGLKVEEAARVLGIPTGTVKTRLMRGRAALRRALEADLP